MADRQELQRALDSKTRQIRNTRDALLRIEEKKSQFVEVTAIPIDLLAEEGRKRELLATLEVEAAQLQQELAGQSAGNHGAPAAAAVRSRKKALTAAFRTAVRFGRRKPVLAALAVLPFAWHGRLYWKDAFHALEAVIARKPYTLESVTEMATVSAGTDGSKILDYRYVYALRPLRSLSKGDTQFKERITAHLGTRLLYWHGSEEESIDHDQPLNKMYDVKFDAPVGSVHTVVTGAQQVFEAGGTAAADGSKGGTRVNGIDLGPDQYALFYPNDEDYIGEIVFVVSSTTVPLSAPANAGFRRSGAEQPVLFKEAASFTSGAGGATISVRWSNVGPGELVGLRFSWKGALRDGNRASNPADSLSGVAVQKPPRGRQP